MSPAQVEESDLPPDEIDTMTEKEALLAEDHPEEQKLEQPYDPGGLGEIHDEPEREEQARPEGAEADETARDRGES